MDTPCQTVSSIDYLVTQGYRDTMGVSDQPEQPPAKDGGELGRLLEEQEALRRVATLVAEGAPPAEVFQAVSIEVAQLLHAEGAALTRFETDGTVTALGGWTSTGGYLHAGTRFALEGTVSGLVFESGQPARIDRYADAPGAALAAAREMGWRSSVGVPITVEGRLWGVLAAVSRSDQPPPPDTEQRLAEFTQLVATAIANAENREQLTRLAEEQAALRRVATLVAEGAPPAEVIEAVITEAGRVVPADAAGLSRYEADGTTALGSWSRTGGYANVGARFPHERGTVGWLVYETGRPGRIGTYEGVPGDVSAAARQAGWRSSVGVPIVVEGRLWGVMTVASTTDQPLPLDTEERLAEFTELVATAIANAESRAELAASRARIVATTDQARRRIERDLHDGAQQRLVSVALRLRTAAAAIPPEEEVQQELAGIGSELDDALADLRELSRGIHPAILSEGGLGPALRTLARRSSVPVELQMGTKGRLPERIEVAAYYVVAEALANVAKHARASVVQVDVDADDGLLRLAIRDDGVGGADPARGSGLVGLKDRVEATGGTLRVESRRGQGTRLLVELGADASQPRSLT